MSKTKQYLTLILIMIAANAWAIPAKPVKKTITLADGTQKEVRLVGDENMHYYLDADNNAYRCDAKGKYVKEDLLKLKKTWNERLSQRNKHRMERSAKLGLPLSPKMLQESQTETADFRKYAKRGAEQNPFLGKKTGLVILVSFPNKEFYETHDLNYYQGFFNEVGFKENKNYGSVHDYFHECSYGQFDLTFDVYGPVMLSKEYSYYGQNVDDYDRYPAVMTVEACNKAKALGADFSKYDWNEDGFVDQVFIIYAGYGEHTGAPSNTLWPHESTLSDEKRWGDGNGPITLDGVVVDTYAITSEMEWASGTTPSGIGPACHEFSHCLSLPDFYDTTSSSYGMNYWDLMDTGSYAGINSGCPAPYTSYERMFCGWLRPTELSTPCEIIGMQPLVEAPEAYIIYNDNNLNEFYMLENRQQQGFGTYDPAHGMLILHVYYDPDVWYENIVNRDPSLQRMTIIPADNILSAKTNDGDTWPGKKGKTKLTDTSTPAAQLYTPNTDGRLFMGKPIEEITEYNTTISFVFDGGPIIAPPVATAATQVAADAFTANWTAVEEATSYRLKITAYERTVTDVEIDAGTLSTQETTTVMVETAATSYRFTGLNGTKRYTYCVQTIKNNAMSPWSNTIKVPIGDTGIGILTTSPKKEGEVYNLQGQRIPVTTVSSASSMLQKGVFIVDGKKVWVK